MIECVRKQNKPYMIYGIIDLKDEAETLLYSGTLAEVAKYANLKNPKGVIQQMYRARTRGQRCRYIKCGYEDEEE